MTEAAALADVGRHFETLRPEEAQRIRSALARSDAVLRQIDHARAHRLSGAAREARAEIGAAVAHLDRLFPPSKATDLRAAPERTATVRDAIGGLDAPTGARPAREVQT